MLFFNHYIYFFRLRPITNPTAAAATNRTTIHITIGVLSPVLTFFGVVDVEPPGVTPGVTSGVVVITVFVMVIVFSLSSLSTNSILPSPPTSYPNVILCVCMFFFSAVCGFLHCNSRKNQRIYCTEHNHTCKNADCFLPAFMIMILLF